MNIEPMCECKERRRIANRRWRMKNPDYEVTEKRREYKRLWHLKKKESARVNKTVS